jgi:nucleoside diphosphate kinase
MKSRTGGIMSRLMVRTGLDLVGARMIAPSQELVDQYAAMMRRHGDIKGTGIDEGTLVADYVQRFFSPDARTGLRRRVMLLVFQGDNAVAKINKALGRFQPSLKSAESVRDTYGDIVRDDKGDVLFLEPAALTSNTVEHTRDVLRLWADASESEVGPLSQVTDVQEDPDAQLTLVMLKPDNFKFASIRPGNIIDIFSGSGLRIVAAKVGRMSVAEALEFYGPVLEVLKKKKKEPAGKVAKAAIERDLGFQLPDETEAQLGELIGPIFGEQQFNELVNFMTGVWPQECPVEKRAEPGESRILALVYYGKNAVEKIRNILGPTDPSKAPPGSIRREYGQDVMVNAAHASDSPENAQREMGIIKIRQDSLQQLLETHYGKKG